MTLKSNIESPHNACMYKETCLSLKADLAAAQARVEALEADRNELQSAFEDAVTAREAALRSEAQPVPEVWKPIETAPKDGLHILVGRFDNSAGYGYLNGQRVHMQTVAHWHDGAFWISAYGGNEETPIPWTHWQPLPAAPGAPK